MSFCVCGPERSSTISALQPSLTQRRLFKIMCWGFFFFTPSINSLISARCWLSGGRALSWPPLTACQMEQLVTIHHQQLPEMNKDILPIIPCCHWWVSRNNYQTLCHFFPLLSLFLFFFFFLMFSSGEMESPHVCLPSCFFIWHTEALRLWNFNDSIVTNTADVIVWRSYCPVHWQAARHFTSIYPSWYKYGRTGKLPFPLFPEFASYKRGQREQDVIVWPEVLPL